MANISQNVGSAVEAAQQATRQSLENAGQPVVSGDASKGMVTVSETQPENVEASPNYMTQDIIGPKLQSQPTRSQESVVARTIARPTAIASDIQAATMQGQPQTQAVPFTPAQNLVTPSQARTTRAVMQEAGSIIKDARKAELNQPILQAQQEQQQTMQVNNEQQQETVKTNDDQSDSVESTQTQNIAKIEQQRYDNAVSVPDNEREMMAPGISKKPAPVTPIGWINQRFADAKQAVRDSVKNTLFGRNKPGNSWRDVLLGDANVPPNGVSIGSENLLEAIREPGSNIIDLVNKNRETPLTIEECLANINILVDAINQSNISVVLSKGPVNRRESIQTRRLFAHVGIGIRVHPTQLKAYNADFDGDEGDLLTDQRLIGKYNRAMSYLVDSEGKAVIDLDFFPIDGIKDDRRGVLKNMIEISFNWASDEIAAAKAADGIVSEYIKCCTDMKNIKKNWAALMRKIDKVAGQLPGYRDENTSRILASLYDYAIERRALMLQTEWNEYKEHSNFNPPKLGVDPFVVKLLDICDAIIVGREAPSEQEFARMYNKYYGEGADKKNVPFRLLADFAKAVNRSEIILLGNDTPVIKDGKVESVPFHTLYETTMSVAHSKRIADRVHLGSHELRAETEVRNNIISEVGYPSDYENYKDFIQAFKVSYNKNQRLINLSQSVMRGDMSIVQNAEYEGLTKLSRIGKPLIDIYGNETMERMFPVSFSAMKENTVNGLAAKYRPMTLSQFAMNNKVSFNRNDIKQHFKTGNWNAMDIVYLLADQRTAQTQRYKKRWERMTSQYTYAMKKVKEAVDNNDWNNYMLESLKLLDIASPDMFQFYGIESIDTFIRSEYGQKLLNVKNANEFRSVWVSMMIEYRMSRADGILDEYDSYINDESLSVEEKTSVINALEMAHANEMDILGSSSLAWDAIVKEEMQGNKLFKWLIAHKGDFTGTRWEKDKANWTLNAKSFWSNSASSQYTSLRQLLMSDVSYETKMNVLSDIVRLRNNYKKIASFEMIGQLAFHPDRIHEGSPFDMDGGISSDNKAIKASVDRLNSYMGKSIKEAQEFATELTQKASENKTEFSDYVYRLATDPGFLVGVDMAFASDAIVSVIDKTYDDSEKIKQQEMVNGYFQALSYQRNGGFYTHLQQVDNKLLNKIGYDQLTSIDLIRIIGDPSITMTVYDQFGNEAELSRKTLCGGDSIDDVINWINENPRMSYIFCRYVANIDEGLNKKDSDKPGNKTTINRIDNGFDLYLDKKTNSVKYQAFSLLNDRPRFLAVVSLITPRGRSVQRNVGQKVLNNLEEFCEYLAYLSSIKDTVNIDSELNKFGITPDAILAATREGGYDDESGWTVDQAQSMYDEVVNEIEECLDILYEANVISNTPFMGSMENWGIDPNSVVSYYDVRQQMSGARTATMIGVEGSETVKNINLKIFLRNRVDRFIRVSYATNEREISKLSEITGRDLLKEIQASKDGSIIVDRNMYPDLEQWVPSDLTLSHGKSNQLTSTAKFLEIKREKGAEEFNAKTKKFGDDGTNSITKFDKWTKSSFDAGKKLLDDIAEAKSRDDAIEMLATALENADKELGYIDINTTFFHSDYMNLADLMLSESGVIRSLEQLSTACRNRLSDYAIAGGLESQMQELTEVVNVLNTENDSRSNNSVVADTLAGMRSIAGGGKFVGRRAARRHSSSFERNYIALSDIFERFEASDYFKSKAPNASRFVPPSREKMAQTSRDAAHNAFMLAKSNESFNKAFTPRREDFVPYFTTFIFNALSGYDFLGVAHDPELMLVPGPQSVVYFESVDDITEPILEQCRQFGITAAFSDPSIIPLEYAEDVMEGDRGVFFLPFFDMMVNGADSDNSMPAPSQFAMDPSNVTVCVEDTTYEIRPGDATAHITRELADRVRIAFSGDEIFDAETLFPNVIKAFPNSDYRIDICDREEVQKYIVDQWDDATIDIGIAQSHPDFYDEMAKMDTRIAEYADRFSEADNASFLTGDMKDDRIVGFAKIIVDGHIRAFAPIIPFHRQMKGKVPRNYRVEKFDFVPGTNTQFQLTWSYSGGILGQAIKFFEGIGASNKMMTNGDAIRSRSLQNGLPVDVMYSTKSIASRMFASNKRINTLTSLMMIPRVDPKYSYNFAELVDAFPSDPKIQRGEELVSIKQEMLAGNMSLQDWIDVYPTIDKFHNDPEIDSIVRFIVRKCVEDYKTVNPSVLLMTRTQDGLMWPMATEFEAFMDTSLNFQNALMHLMHDMTAVNGGSPICPRSIDDNSDNCLFKPVTQTGNDYGVLQMMVPHYTYKGEEYMVPENVYLHFGFFGDVFSGFGRLNLTASIHADDLNVANSVSDSDLVQLASLGRREIAAVDKMRLHAIDVDRDGNMVNKGDNNETR